MVDPVIKISKPDFMNHLIETLKFESYLEIGVGFRAPSFASGRTWKEINCKFKTGVDPCKPQNFHKPYLEPDLARGIEEVVFYQGTSENFFKDLKPSIKFDLIFIDGFHADDTVSHDVIESLKVLNDGGIIVMHDVGPVIKEQTNDDGNIGFGTAYLTFMKIRNGTLVGDEIYACSHMDPENHDIVGVFWKIPTGKLGNCIPLEECNHNRRWESYISNRSTILNILKKEQIVEKYYNFLTA